MADHDDFLDNYIGYRIFEDSMKKAQVEARHLSVIPEVPGVSFG